MSLKAKTVLAFSGFTLLLSFALAMIAAHQLSTSLEEQFVERGKSLVERVAKEAFYYLYIFGEGNLDVLVDSVVDEDVLYVQVVKDGEIVAQHLTGDFAPEVAPGPPGLHVEELRAPDGTWYLDIRRSLLGRIGGKEPVSSYVRLGLSLAAIGEKVAQEHMMIALGAGGIALLGIGAAFLLYWKVFAALEEIVRAMRDFGRGMLERRAKVSRSDEIGTLAQEFNEMADAIVKMKEELERISRAKSEFISIISHELRTPLHTILGYTELLLMGSGEGLTSQQRRYLEAIRRSGEHLLELLESALLFSKLELGVEELRREEFDCREVVREAVEAGPLPPDGGPEIKLRLPSDPVWIRADRTKMRQILINLLNNAVRFARTEVEVGLSRELDGVHIAVRDDGPGIPVEDQEKVFEPFVKLGSKGSREGLGLGLAIVKRYAEMHGGKAWLESIPGEGTTVHVKLPVKGGGDADPDSGG
ncbi:ATP-binding protein [Candidatus Bipolaricaulota sp. J31]